MNCVKSLSILMLALPASVVVGAERPNIILVMADDLGWGDVGFNGNKIIKTPNMDKMSQDGVIFNRFYSACAVSSPTRASVLTGRSPYRTGVFSANVGILRPEEVTIPEMLKEAGYTTGHFGKWHLGTLTDQQKDGKRGAPGNKALFNPPSEHGYDAALVTEVAVPTYDPMRIPVEDPKPRWWNALGDGASKYGGTAYWDIDGKRVETGVAGDDSKVIMDRVIPFIDGAVDRKSPFFSVVWFHAPHVPYVSPPETAALYDGYSDNERNYYGCITALDAQMGRLIDHLKAKKIYNNTIILFCSDNGPERNTPGSAGDLRGIKRFIYEGGIRVPAFALWGKKIERGVRSDVPCFTSDYLPLVADIVGLDLPKDRQLDGESFLPLLKGKEFVREKPMIFAFRSMGALMQGSLKLYFQKGVYELYDIDKDPSEKSNIIDQMPEVAEKMKMQLREAMDNYKASFEGDEYGTESRTRVSQKWSSIGAL